MSSPAPLEVEAEDSMEEDTNMLPTDKFTMPTRADEVVELWRGKLADGSMSPNDFQDHWRVTVPRIYSPQPNRTCLDWSFDEELGTSLLITPLEQLVWGGAGRGDAGPRAPALCGRVFKCGEPVYSCRECGMDNTCVLCVECFKVSAHRQHKYKICQSNGGGCCDCGDAEAWRRDAFCDKHKGPSEDSEAGTAGISPDVIERMKIVASVCLSYCFRLLTPDHAPGLPNDLRLKDAERDPLQILDQPDCYCTVLYNDETHTFEQVITTLTRVMKVSHRDSVELVSLIDREGRALVKCTSFQQADKLKADIEMFTSRHGPTLKVLVMHAHLVAHQTFAMKLLTWLQNFVAQEPALRLAVSQVALGQFEWPTAAGAAAWPAPTPAGGVAEGVMLNDWRMWKAARSAWHRLLIATTLMDYETKKTMAQLFTRNYGSMLKDFIRDDHDHSLSISSLSVQLFTTPTLAHRLVAQQDALFVVLNTFVSECSRRVNAKLFTTPTLAHRLVAQQDALFVVLNTFVSECSRRVNAKLFTTPTLAHRLVAQQDALFVVLNTFVSECSRRVNAKLFTTPTLAHRLVARQDALFVVLNTFVSECSRRVNAKLFTTPTLAHRLVAQQDALFVVLNTFVSECSRRVNAKLFTTPTLAHRLVAQQDALFVVLNTFVSECSRRVNAKSRLEFDRNHVSSAFKRAQFVLYDVKYLLSCVPATFDDELRRGFLHGLTLMLSLLLMMQGMDEVVRQVGQHMEYEPEWESAFNLHVKLAHSITLALEWCGADRALTASAYRMVLRRLCDAEPTEPRERAELGNQSALVIPYDVSTRPVSIHRPLSRFAAGLHLLLDKHGLSYHSPEFSRPDKPKPTPEELIEPVLRTTAMIAGVHAGMWRRNGFALLNQLYFYHNVKCRAEMLDRDVLMLQIGASLIESNEFIIHVMNKLNLLEWAKPDFESKGIEEDALRHTISMLDEFLGLLITVVGSRYVPGVGEVTAEDRTKKEIIQMLCIKPMAHSELNRCLPEDQLHETGLEAVINEVATFSKPTGGANRGIYTLKPALYDQYEPFFYHYTREELSRSEEAQRTRRKQAGLPECCPPPQLPKLTPPFRLLANLLQCAASVTVLKTVLERALDLRAACFAETHVHKVVAQVRHTTCAEGRTHVAKVGHMWPSCHIPSAGEPTTMCRLRDGSEDGARACARPARRLLRRDSRAQGKAKLSHLLAHLLQCAASVTVLKTVLERALDLRAACFAETHVHKALHLMGYALRDEESGHYSFVSFAETAARAGLLPLLQQLASSPRVEAHRPLAHWLLNKIRSMLGHSEEGSGDADSMDTDQKDKPNEESAADAEKSRRAKLAAERRAKILAQMQAAQNKFICNNARLFASTDVARSEPERGAERARRAGRGGALGTWGGAAAQPPRVCIMCQEEVSCV
ncbi:unnamed protein product [Plutella xylostella]|uniref:E3 ubiquitin-protein ligase n=1 Tax=Plutella xylostella TaxID=51655 RepID=A0A8S4FJU5_PLUXY|nr:unnamed protein product [Plutella xylostella]